MPISPAPMFPEKGSPQFELGFAPSIPMNKGPLRFEEGIATDTDVPHDFAQGAYMDTAPSPMRQSHPNPESMYKHAADTMRERAHVGAATWVEAPAVLNEFVQGSMAGDAMPYFEMEYNTGGHMNRPNVTVVYD